MTIDEIKAHGADLTERLSKLSNYLHVDETLAQIAEIEKTMAQNDFWDDKEKAQATVQKLSSCKNIVEPFNKLKREADDFLAIAELAEEDPSFLEESDDAWAKLEAGLSKLEIVSFLSGKFDRCNSFVYIHAGAGGTESCDWASILLRMYRRWFERRGFQDEIIDMQPGDEAGIKSAVLKVTGEFVYGYMRAERGVHRLVRISPFDANARRHTSFASLDVVAELEDETTVELRPEDLEVDTYRSGGAGGQHVNKTDSAIRIRHVPTGIVVTCDAERSQFANRKKAMAILRAKVYEYEEDRKRAALERFYGEKGSISWGNQIRSYVLQPYTMAKDLRTGHETGNVQAVLDGDLAPFVSAWLEWKSAGSPRIKGAAAADRD